MVHCIRYYYIRARDLVVLVNVTGTQEDIPVLVFIEIKIRVTGWRMGVAMRP